LATRGALSVRRACPNVYFDSSMKAEVTSSPVNDELVTQVHQKLVEKLSSENRRLKHLESELTKKYEFQRILTSVSTELMQRSFQETLSYLETALKQLIDFARAERCMLLVFSEDGATMEEVYESVKDDSVTRIGSKVKGSSLSSYPVLEACALESEPLIVRDCSELSPAQRADRLLDPEVRSSIHFPLLDQGRISGLITIDWLKSELDWEDEMISLLPVAGEMLLRATSQAKLEQQKHESEERFRLISEQSLVGIVLLQDGLIKYTNEQWSRISEIAVEDMYGWEANGFISMVHPDDRNLLIEQARKKQAGEPDVLEQYEWRLNTPSGKTKWISIYSRTVPYSGRNADLCTLIDVTEQKDAQNSLRESEQRLRAVFNAAEDAIFIKDVEGRYTQVNPAMEKLLGLSKDKIIGRTERDLMSPDVAKRVREADAKVLSGATVDLEDCLDIKGVRRFFHNLKVPLINADGEVIGLCGVSRDVTLRKSAALAKEKHLKSEAQNKAKTEFLARVSHELRTPLNAIIGYSEMLAEDAESDGLENYSKDLRKILDAGGHLLGLINDILDMSKVESGKMEIFAEKVLVEEVVQEVFSIIRPLLQSNENQFEVIREFPEGLEMTTDQIKLRQILLNLLGNASKFTRQGTVTMRIEEMKDAAPARIKFSVQDDGIGIEQSKVARIFRRFTQAEEDTALKFGGTGLGLPITKAFVDMMSGKIEVSSEIGKGSLFEVDLPMHLPRKQSLGSWKKGQWGIWKAAETDQT